MRRLAPDSSHPSSAPVFFRELAAVTSLIDASKSGGNDGYIIAGDLNTLSVAAEHGQCTAAGMSDATLTVCTMHHVLTRVVHYWSGRPGTVVEVGMAQDRTLIEFDDGFFEWRRDSAFVAAQDCPTCSTSQNIM